MGLAKLLFSQPHIPKSRPLWAVLRVLSQSGLFCDAPHLTASDKKFGCGANIGCVCPSDKKLGLALGKVRVVKRRSQMGYYGLL